MFYRITKEIDTDWSSTFLTSEIKFFFAQYEKQYKFEFYKIMLI